MPTYVFYLCAIGDCPERVLSAAAEGLREVFAARVHFHKPLRFDLPAQAFSRKRGQYSSTHLLTFLDGQIRDEARPLLAVTAADLYVPGLNFVFGEANPRAKLAVISTYRLQYALPPGPAGESMYRERIAKEAVHEIGHVLGLRHCTDPTCVMFFSNSLADTDRKSKAFCSKCRARLGLR